MQSTSDKFIKSALLMYGPKTTQRFEAFPSLEKMSGGKTSPPALLAHSVYKDRSFPLNRFCHIPASIPCLSTLLIAQTTTDFMETMGKLSIQGLALQTARPIPGYQPFVT
jgi:hypothetical protein